MILYEYFCNSVAIIYTSHMEAAIGKLTATLKESNFSLTQSRVQVFRSLFQRGPASISQLAQRVADVDRATVYRVIELFERLGIVNRIWHGFKHQVELSEIFMPHHHHALCQNCGTMIDIASPELESILAYVAKQHSFMALTHSVELSGYCKNCSN